MKQTTFNIYVMSYKSAESITSHKFFEYCTVVVREEEEADYRANGVNNLLVIPDGAVDDFMSTLYWIIDNTPEDVIFICDDDCEDFAYRLDDTYSIKSLMTGDIDKECITAEVERIAQLLVDLDLGIACDNASQAPYAYTQEFTVKGMPGHFRWINKPCLKATYDPKDEAASDIDMVMQELLGNRIILQPRYFICKSTIGKNTTEDRATQKIFIESMKNKWGKYYDYNFKRNIASINVSR